MVFLLRQVLGVGAHQGVAVQGGGHQDALGDIGGHREEDVVDRDLSPVEDGIFAAPGGDVEFGADTGGVHDLVGVQTGGIHHPAAGEIAPRGVDAGDLLAYR